jgi:formamidopyrimidine-DNA glycosylase
VPEIIEVEKLVRQLRPAFEGRAIVYTESLYSDNRHRPIHEHFLRKHTADDWERIVRDNPITSMSRVGKNLIFNFGRTRHLLQVHLNSTGWFLPGNELAARTTTINPTYKAFIQSSVSVHPYQHAMVAWVLDDGQLWYFVDSRTFGRYYIWSQDDVKERKACDLERYGADWLREPDKATRVLRDWRPHSPRLVKDVLLDQRITTGLGNWLYSEIMHRAGLHPHEAWIQLNADDKEALANIAINLIDTGMQSDDYSYWRVFGQNKKGTSCYNACGGTIHYIKDRGSEIRGSYYCPTCQPLRPSVTIHESRP